MINPSLNIQESKIKNYEPKEFEMEDFWSDDVLCESEKLPGNLMLQAPREYKHVVDPFQSYANYNNKGEPGNVRSCSLMVPIYFGHSCHRV